MKELPQKYDHTTAEKKWQTHWAHEKTYRWHDDAPREDTFVIDTPPPTVSGLLHMGHVFSYTQCDFVARYQRMKGKDVFYPMGFDDNGLPTERLVEKVKKKRAVDYDSREAFVKVCDEVAEDARKDFRSLFQSIALSIDWDQEYHSISKESQQLSQLSFLDLYEKGHVERKLEPMLWDPVDQTAIAQAEVVDKELESFENYVTFGLDDGSGERVGEFQIMTTRPELLPACVAVMCDPAEYPQYEGKQAICALSGLRVPIIPDEKVDASKGTGMVMCCTFGDETDVHWYKSYKDEYDLLLRVVLNRYGKLDAELLGDVLSNSPHKATIIETLGGLNLKKAREAVINALTETGDLAEQKPITHAVKCAERSGAPLEILPTPQWFVKVLDKKEALKAKAAECNWHPQWMKVRMDQWIDGLSWDWCISRQRYFGVPFPIWYSKRTGEEGKILIAAADQLPCNPLTSLPEGYSRDEVEPEVDVMDTWATSAISPQISSKGISAEHSLNPERHAKLFPVDVRPQAHEIIRTWAFYTLAKAHLHEDTIPWKNLMISGWCLAEDKTKMSKSKGNVVTPVSLIEERGTDAVRYWAATSRLGQDTAYSTDLLKIGKKLVNKLWNATKFAAIHLDKIEKKPINAVDDLTHHRITETLDLWILSKLNKCIKKSSESFEKYEYADALRAIEDFFWNDFCDNYLELVKKRAYAADLEEHLKPKVAASNPMEAMALLSEEQVEVEHIEHLQCSAVHTIYHCLQGILRLFAPFVPHITEELFSHIFVDDYNDADSLHARNMWPKAEDYPYNEQAEYSGTLAVALTEIIRRAKSEQQLSIKHPIESLTISSENTAIKNGLTTSIINDLQGGGNITSYHWETTIEEPTHRHEELQIALTINFAPQQEKTTQAV